MLPLRGTDKHGRPIMLSRNCYEPGEYNVDTMMRAFYMLFDVFILENELHTVVGMTHVQDCEGTRTGHMLMFTPPAMKKMMVIWQVRTIKRYDTLRKVMTIILSFNRMVTRCDRKDSIISTRHLYSTPFSTFSKIL